MENNAQDEKIAEEIVYKSFDVVKTVKTFRINGLTKTADEYLVASGECKALIAEALKKARAEEKERCAKEIESWIKYYSIEFFEDVKSGEHGKRVDDCTAHTMRIMLPRLADAIRRME